MIEIRGIDVDNPHGGLDEVIGKDCACVHLEKMDTAAWCLILDDKDGRQVIINLGYLPRERGPKAYAFVYEDNAGDKHARGGGK